ncbi:MAG: hypothetical protein OEW09_18775, partial [Anaerolineae bacterium]|nr:hypothetical protein [Anaerolineae bacterium]
HLWIFLDPIAAKPVSKVLRRVVEEGVEVFPKQNRISPKGYGSLVRGPLGIHLRTGKRYGFLERGFHRRGGFDPDAALLITKAANSRRLPWAKAPSGANRVGGY